MLDRTGNPELDPAEEPYQVLEGMEYRYEFDVPTDVGPVTTDRPEVFFPDTVDGRSGRFRPGLHTGTIPVRVAALDCDLGSFSVEVRSRKLRYRDHYRWMLRDLAEIFAEVVMERFSTAEQRFSVDDERDAMTLYQRFVLLQSLLNDQHLMGAIQYLLSRPYTAWEPEDETRSTSRGIRGSSSASRELSRPGPRVPWKHGPVATVPRSIRSTRTVSNLDNGPNRFVKFALRRWRAVIAQVHDALEAVSNPSAVIRRGITETRALLEQLDAILAEELFREVSDLTYFPASNQVLQKRAGYRDVYRTYIQFDLASKLSWAADDVYGAGKRNVATLYEYWIFVQLTRIVAGICGGEVDAKGLFSIRRDGLGVNLQTGKTLLFGGSTEVGGRRVHLDLYFNRQFKRNAGGHGSWTRAMRPDCSLLISPSGFFGDGEDTDAFEPVWVHFDAKYRVDQLTEVMAGPDDPDDDDVMHGSAKGQDLLKMHAYRDAIRRSAGAYVLYPGSHSQPVREYHEILPGLGAFPLVPGRDGDVHGASLLRQFIEDVVQHASSDMTQHVRARFWGSRAYATHERAGELHGLPPAPFLPAPPADTLVLLGYVKNADHYEWIRRDQRYNLRGDPERRGAVGLGSRELATDLVILYGPPLDDVELWRVRGEPEVHDLLSMRALHYPEPQGTRYFLLPLESIEANQWSGTFSPRSFEPLMRKLSRREHGAPVVVTWSRLVQELSLQYEPLQPDL